MGAPPGTDGWPRMLTRPFGQVSFDQTFVHTWRRDEADPGAHGARAARHHPGSVLLGRLDAPGRTFAHAERGRGEGRDDDQRRHDTRDDHDDEEAPRAP